MIGGLFKHLFWIAPVFAISFYYVAARQEEQTATMEKDKLQFNNEFAHSQKELSSNADGRAFWGAEENKTGAQIAEAERAEKIAKARTAEVMKQLDRESNQSANENTQNVLPAIPK